jgi:hypothetical protein
MLWLENAGLILRGIAVTQIMPVEVVYCSGEFAWEHRTSSRLTESKGPGRVDGGGVPLSTGSHDVVLLKEKLLEQSAAEGDDD